MDDSTHPPPTEPPPTEPPQIEPPPIGPDGPYGGTVRFTPDRRYTWLAAAGLLLALTVAGLTGDRDGRLLALVAAAVLAVSVACDLIFAPRLEASAEGLVIRSPFTRARLAWVDVESLRVVERARLGLRNRALEVDAGEVLAEFSTRTLGTELDAALARIEAVRPS